MRKGFTLLEVTLVITLIALIASIGLPIFQNIQVRNDLDVATNITVQSLRRVQFLARAVDGDMSWGVKINTGEIIIFKGASFLTRDPSFDELFKISENILISGINEFIFNKFSGLPQIYGLTTFTSINNETRTINLNQKGTINY